MNGTPDIIAAGLKMIASLGVVLVMILALLYGLRKLTRQRVGAGGGKQIQVLESHYMGVKKTISLVHVPGKVLVVGVAGDRISLLDRGFIFAMAHIRGGADLGEPWYKAGKLLKKKNN